MKINMYMVRIRFVSDSKGPLEAKAKRAVVTLSHDRETALQQARAYYADMTSAGVVVEYDTPSQLPDAFDVERSIVSRNNAARHRYGHASAPTATPYRRQGSMTREDSIRLKTWVTNDGRYLTIDQISPDHLLRLKEMLRQELTPGYDTKTGPQIARDFAAKRENILDYSIDGSWAELDLDAFRSAWLSIIDDEFTRRAA